MEHELPKRKQIRWDKRDYSEAGRYFITVCTEGRKPILSRVISVGGDVLDAPRTTESLYFGKIADRYINQLNDFYDYIEVDQCVIMPNHIDYL